MFTAEQKYVPVSFPVTFDESNCPLKPKEWSSCQVTKDYRSLNIEMKLFHFRLLSTLQEKLKQQEL